MKPRRGATSTLYHVASAVSFAWEGAKIHAVRGDATRLLLSRLVVDHRLTPQDPFAVLSGGERNVADRLLGGKLSSMADVAGALTTA